MEALDEIARRQWGLLTHAQAHHFLTRIQLERMQKSKRLINVHRGIYRMAGAPVTWQQEIVAALLALPAGVASHNSVERLHDLRTDVGDRVHITMPKTSSHVRRSVKLHRSDLLDEETCVVQRITCTTVERTIIDIAVDLSRPQLAFVLDEAVVAGKTTFAKVDEALKRCGFGGRKGVRALNAILRERLPLAEGAVRQIEMKVLKACRKAKVPQPRTQFRVLTKYGPYYIDAAWPDQKIGAESDGYTVHTASRRRHNDDRRRRNELETLGWKIFNFTHDMPTEEIAAVLAANVSVVGG